MKANSIIRACAPAAVATAAVLALAACGESYERNEPVPPPEPVPENMPPAAEDMAPPASDTVPDTPPIDPSMLPPDQRSSEQSVQPESETLFY